MEDKVVKILLIEDDTSFAGLIRDLLSRVKGTVFRIEWSNSLSAGLNRLSENSIDVVLLDLNLPDSAGLDTFVRVHIHAPHLLIVVLTGEGDGTLGLKAVRMGAEDYLQKGQTDNSYIVRSIQYAIQRHGSVRTTRTSSDQDLFRSIIESSMDGVIIFDVSGAIVYANTAAELFFGFEGGEFVGKKIDFPYSINGKTEIELIRKSGDRFIAEIRVGEIDWKGQGSYVALLRDITERKRKEKSLESLSLTDDLTGLYNRRGFLNLAEHSIISAQRTKRGFLIAFLDLDGLKWINDQFGHSEGDLALIEISDIIKDVFRRSDVLARLGGDEFAVLAADVTFDSIELINKRLERLVAARNQRQGRLYKLSISMGIAYYDPDKPGSVDSILARADSLMYENKQKKKTTLQGREL